jgi:hypothetical protein
MPRILELLQEVKCLPPREYAGGLEPYLVLQVARTTWPLHRRAGPPLHLLRTRTLRHSFNPFFDQTFVLDVKRSELKVQSQLVILQDFECGGEKNINHHVLSRFWESSHA